MAQAESIKSTIRKIARGKKQLPPRMPNISRKWCWRFRKQMRIERKKPNRKYKVSYKKINSRTRKGWLNTWRVMLGVKLLWGTERKAAGKPDTPFCHVVDQKDQHFNETESKERSSLVFKGSKDTALKTNHSQSRARVSLNTHMSNDPTFEAPIECLFKLKTGRMLRSLRLPRGVLCSLAHSESGSYNAAIFLEYLKRWLPLWDETREAQKDYHILFLDAFTGHKSDAVKNLCKERGFLTVPIGGGCASVQCGLDTDLHQDLSRVLQELEMADFHEQQVRKPWRVPTRERQTLLDDVCAYWFTYKHAEVITPPIHASRHASVLTSCFYT